MTAVIGNDHRCGLRIEVCSANYTSAKIDEQGT